ncbi:siderophore ABC transporter substrate-binding protein [Nocardiopsis valliformis]|uniref:siderophore ABC transporter substrate-binding protein n=1 Tax=Nocardiopsis valliformis TaxID=239974 RepID=UPI000347652E|nr:ABC transporter substrate-binding protein [Nocardiopsis valliformis]
MKSPGRPVTALSLILASSLVLAACSTDAQDSDDSAAADGSTIEIEDNNGTQTVTSPPASVVALDNRTFETLSDWDIELSAAAVSLMPDTIDYTRDESLVDIGMHREPDLEAIVAAEPDLVINGQRFTDHQDDIASLVPDATILNLEPREGEPFDDELKRQISVLGEIFDKQDEAEQLIEDFDAAVERVNEAYDEDDSVMAVTTSGGDIGYLAPGVGRTLGPAFDIFGLTPALQVEGASDDHQGDDISVEAIADSNPDWILVMDRDAAVAADEAGYEEADKILSESEALASVNAVENEQIVYMPLDTYTNEGIQTYTEFFNAFADALEAQA